MCVARECVTLFCAVVRALVNVGSESSSLFGIDVCEHTMTPTVCVIAFVESGSLTWGKMFCCLCGGGRKSWDGNEHKDTEESVCMAKCLKDTRGVDNIHPLCTR